jgi:pyrroloquinoline quinone (PQQ) biosynthesis protein C
MADFARHYAGYSQHFRRYLGAVLLRLDDPRHRASLQDNLAEESGRYADDELNELATLGLAAEWFVGVPHPELFRRFCAAVQVSPPSPLHEAPTVVCWREKFMKLLSSGSAAVGIGAIGLGTENIVRHIYAPICEALARVSELSPRDTVFFPLHTAVDDHHTATLAAIAVDLADTHVGRRELRAGMSAALDLRERFWDWLFARALDPASEER